MDKIRLPPYVIVSGKLCKVIVVPVLDVTGSIDPNIPELEQNR